MVNQFNDISQVLFLVLIFFYVNLKIGLNAECNKGRKINKKLNDYFQFLQAFSININFFQKQINIQNGMK
ncbi:hypothetical protein pb186bvf_021128 [Paramecium bursaria]